MVADKCYECSRCPDREWLGREVRAPLGFIVRESPLMGLEMHSKQ